LGLFELTGQHGEKRAEGRSELEAARLAVRHINQRGSSLLPGFKLQLLTNDTKVRKNTILTVCSPLKKYYSDFQLFCIVPPAFLFSKAIKNRVLKNCDASIHTRTEKSI
jgi:hypothetical protein